MQLEYFSLNVEHNLIGVTNEFMVILTLTVKQARKLRSRDIHYLSNIILLFY